MNDQAHVLREQGPVVLVQPESRLPPVPLQDSRFLAHPVDHIGAEPFAPCPTKISKSVSSWGRVCHACV